MTSDTSVAKKGQKVQNAPTHSTTETEMHTTDMSNYIDISPKTYTS